MTVSRSAEFAVAPEAVWAVLADFGGLAHWVSDIHHSSMLTEGDVAPGAVRRVQLGNTVLLERVTEWEPPTALAYAIDGLPPVVRTATNRWSIESSSGGAAVTITSEVDAGPRPPQRLVARVVARAMARTSESMLTGMAAELARREGATP